MSEIRHTDVKGADAKLFGTELSFPMKAYCGAATAQLHDFHLTPGNAVDTCAEGFANCLFCGKAGGKAIDLAATLPYLSLREDTLEKTLAVPFVNLAYAVYLDNVNADRDVDSLRREKWSRKTSHACRSKEPVRERFPRSAHEGREEQRRVVVH
jgi:hypothetical protein